MVKSEVNCIEIFFKPPAERHNQAQVFFNTSYQLYFNNIVTTS